MNIIDFGRIRQFIPYLTQGITITLAIAFFSTLLGVVLGILINTVSKRKVLGKLAFAYVDVFRGTPVILQLSLIYFAFPRLLTVLAQDWFGYTGNITITAFAAAIITFSLNSSAYVSEIIRSGVNSVDPGEIEAAKALGVDKFHIYKDIILPIAFKNSFPALMNEIIMLVKESSIVSIIGLQDLMRRQQIVSAQTYLYFEPLLYVGLIYYIIVKIMSIAAKKVEGVLMHD
jgi:amine acid ABC transporter, permease protein, 3-TM region, His/Glu/Gln/Arg/opine family